ncbi:Aste57867_1234 [Aphanomyces stellatus]|uniref:Aste57867_1234 protein n=1 Tax=Aphanomyces stellatus TaxID=120398 RepID=A0A485K5Y3_9STRA|nr:hypothetical protein As57867_001233 [Aphanomyces stellatus]VFT78453.1 Aste57867_1234 [Aphanomyces stellatus]
MTDAQDPDIVILDQALVDGNIERIFEALAKLWRRHWDLPDSEVANSENTFLAWLASVWDVVENYMSGSRDRVLSAIEARKLADEALDDGSRVVPAMVALLLSVVANDLALFEAALTEETTDDATPDDADIFNAIASGEVAEVQAALTRHTGDLNTAFAIDGGDDCSMILTPLMYACASWIYPYISDETNSILSLLLAHPTIDINATTPGGATVLMQTAQDGCESAMRVLLEMPDVDVNHQDHDGCTALYYASSSIYDAFNSELDDRAPVVQALLDHNDLDINLTTTDGESPLIAAVRSGQEGICKLLLQLPTLNVNCQGPAKMHLSLHETTGNQTALYIASELGQTELVEAMLTRADVDVNLPDEAGNTPLIAALSSSRLAVVEKLLAHPTLLVNAQFREDKATALFVACENGLDKVVSLLLAREDIDVNATNSTGVSPLLAAMRFGHLAIVDLLLARADVDVNCRGTAKEETALHVATREGQTDLVQKLLHRMDIDVTVPNKAS